MVEKTMFFGLLVISMIACVFWKKKIDPHGKTVWIYLAWLIICNAISLMVFDPWGFLG